MTQHARLGASGAKRWMTCPGSVRLEEPFPDETSSYAAEGTAAHALAEACLNGELDRETLEESIGSGLFLYHDEESGEDVFSVPVTKGMLKPVREYLDYVDSVKADIEAAGDEVLEQWVEARVNLELLSPPEPMFGTADLVLWTRDRHLHVIDYKHGAGVPVDVVDNPQPQYYALGTVLSLTKKLPETVTCHIAQPRGHHPDGPFRSWTFDYEHLKAFKDELVAAVDRVQDPEAELVPGDHCRFCKAHAVCPAQKNLVDSTVVDLFAMADAVEEEQDPAELLQDAETLTDDQIARVLQVKDLVSNWFRSVESHAAAKLHEDPESVPGWKLVEGRKGNRQWKDEEEALEYLFRSKRIPKKDLCPPKLGSPAHVERVLKARGDESRVDLEELVTRSDGKPKLAPATDPRPALQPLDVTNIFPISETDA